jgi:hypothetical protein
MQQGVKFLLQFVSAALLRLQQTLALAEHALMFLAHGLLQLRSHPLLLFTQ